MSAADALDRLARWPRQRLATLPTALVRAPRLAAAAGRNDVDLLIKMDSETGFALGGNKVRKLEVELAPERLAGVTCLLTAGGPQSNHCRVTAAAAARLGLDCVLVLNGPAPTVPTGNALLHRLFGARIHTVEDREARTAALAEVAAGVEREGGRPLVVPIGASTGLGALGYASAAVELTAQLDTSEPPAPRTWLFVASSSCGTLAGLLLGLALLDRDDVELVGASADESAAHIREETVRIATEGAELLGCRDTIAGRPLHAVDDCVGAGYGVPTPEGDEATGLFARTEGLLLDPTYTAKAGAAMLEWLASGRIGAGDRVVFLHTGGHPALLA